MKEKILNNLSLKVLSFVCAILLWVAIVNVYDPSTGVTVSGVTVELINTETLTSKDYSYEVVDGSKISVYVSGPRSVVTDISASDIVATADLSQVTAFSDYADISVKVVKNGTVLDSVEVAPKTTAVKLNIENRVSQTYNIETALSGTPAEGYTVSGVQVSPSSVKITGTASSVAAVASVRAACDVSGATMDIADTAAIILYDANGNEINDDKLEVSRTTVDFRATLLATKVVPLSFASKGNPAANFVLTGLECAQAEVTLAGSSDVLKDIHGISIPDTAIDVTNLNADKTFYVQLSNYLPEKVNVMSENVINVTARISAVQERDFIIYTDSITVRNLASDKTAAYSNPGSFYVTIRGTEATLNGLTSVSLQPYIDVAGMADGSTSVPLQVVLPANTALKQAYPLEIQITSRGSETSGTVAATEGTTEGAAETSASEQSTGTTRAVN